MTTQSGGQLPTYPVDLAPSNGIASLIAGSIGDVYLTDAASSPSKRIQGCASDLITTGAASRPPLDRQPANARSFGPDSGPSLLQSAQLRRFADGNPIPGAWPACLSNRYCPAKLPNWRPVCASTGLIFACNPTARNARQTLPISVGSPLCSRSTTIWLTCAARTSPW